MKKTVCILISVLILNIIFLTGCDNANKLTAEQQNCVDMIWESRDKWNYVTGYFNGPCECTAIAFGKYNGNEVFIVHSEGNGNTIASNAYYIYSNRLVKIDDYNSIGLISINHWDSDSTKEDLEQIYAQYLY